MFSYAWNQFSHKQKKRQRMWQSDGESAQRKEGEMEAADRDEIREGDCEVGETLSRQGLSWRHRSWLMEWELVWQSESRAPCHWGENRRPESEISEVPAKNGKRLDVCANACRAAVFLRSSLFLFSQPVTLSHTWVCAPDTCLLIFLFFCQKKGSLKVRGSAAGQASLPGARQGFDKKFQSTSDVFLPTRKLKKFVFCSTLLC